MSNLSKQLVSYGYAPGNYTCKCVTCGQEFVGDKRASRCESCAERCAAAAVSEPRLPSSNLRLSDKRLAEVIRYLETYERPPGHAMADAILALQELSNRRAFSGDSCAPETQPASKIRSLDPLVIDGDELAQIEPGTGDPAGTYMKYKGMIWVNDGWLDANKAAALRDWLNTALSGDSSAPETFARKPGDCSHEHATIKCPDCGIDFVGKFTPPAYETKTPQLVPHTAKELADNLRSHASDLEEERGKGLMFIADIRRAADVLEALSSPVEKRKDVLVCPNALKGYVGQPCPVCWDGPCPVVETSTPAASLYVSRSDTEFTDCAHCDQPASGHAKTAGRCPEKAGGEQTCPHPEANGMSIQDREIAPGVYAIGEVHWNYETRDWRCLANVNGALCVVQVQLKPLKKTDKSVVETEPKLTSRQYAARNALAGCTCGSDGDLHQFTCQLRRDGDDGKGAVKASIEHVCACIPLSQRSDKYCGNCGGRIPEKASIRPLTQPERDALHRAADASVTEVDPGYGSKASADRVLREKCPKCGTQMNNWPGQMTKCANCLHEWYMDSSPNGRGNGV